MEGPVGPDALAVAVAKVMQRVRYIKQTGFNKFHGYRYASHEDILSAVQKEMAAEGLMLAPSDMVVTTTQHTDNARGKPQWRTDVIVTYTLRHESGATQRVMSAGCGIDGEDKGVYKALTGAHKYALTELFLIPTGDKDDPEFDGAQPERQPEPKAPPPPAEKATPDDLKDLRAAFFAKWQALFPPPKAGEYEPEVVERVKKAQEESRRAVTFKWFNLDSLSDDKASTMDRADCRKFTARLRKMTDNEFKAAVDKVLGEEP